MNLQFVYEGGTCDGLGNLWRYVSWYSTYMLVTTLSAHDFFTAALARDALHDI